MKAGVFKAEKEIAVEEVPDSRIEAATDAIVRITHACVCGSDLWFYRGQTPWQPGWRTGHEWMGVVEEVGSEVTSVKAGDRVVAPFVYADGSCEYCQEGLPTSCLHGSPWGGGAAEGGQAEAIRCPFADATLVRLPDAVEGDEALLKRILPLTDVMPTGHHAAVSAGVAAGSTAVVVGDGAVGLCAVIAAKRLGAQRIIAAGHHPGRLELARRLGATDVVDSAEEGVHKRVREMTGGGAHSVLECVGAASSMKLACQVARPGGTIGHVGVPVGSPEGLDMRRLFVHNITLRGGIAPARVYLEELLADVLAERIDPSPVLDLEIPLDELARGYAAMDQREAIKVLVRA